MDLFEPIEKVITLPKHFFTQINIAGNPVNCLANRAITVKVQVKDCNEQCFELITGLKKPFHIIYLKKWGKRYCPPNGYGSLKFKSKGTLSTLDEKTVLAWEQHPLERCKLSPSDIVDSWLGIFNFKQELPDKGQFGLRLPQLGALHAISAHFASDRTPEPATVVLPTGTGKTETMISSLIYQQCKLVLVIVPSQSLRTQISDKFLTLGCLPELGVLPQITSYPYVGIIKSGIKNIRDAQKFVSNCNVIVSTPNIINHSAPEVVDLLCAKCSHMFVDEAHHITARTWSAIRDNFAGKHVIHYTATPFRNDGNSLGAKIIYNYSMGEAQRAGYFKQINLKPVEEYYDDKVDLRIAEEATKQLKNDCSDGYDHLIMARVSSVSKANEIHAIYCEVAPEFNPIVIHSKLSKSTIDKLLDKLMNGDSKIAICVNMLGEGFDLPSLKIAAIHDLHKSLAITLQFIGRFTRSSRTKKIGNATVVANIADPNVEKGLESLYSQGADWDIILRKLSENRVTREINLQEIVDALRNGQGNLHEQISLSNLTPSYSAMLFKTDCDEWAPMSFKKVIPSFDESWHSLSLDKNILVVLAVHNTAVKWGKFKDIHDTNYKLLVIYWNKEKKALFVFSNDYKAFHAEDIANEICSEQCELISGKQIFNIFNGIEYPLVRNLGASQIGAISFTQYFGPNVTEGLGLVEASQSALSNIATLGYEDGERVIWGCSQKKGKIWSPKSSGTLVDWCDWVNNAWDKVTSDKIDANNITNNFLRPEKISKSYNSYPIAVNWGECIYSSYEDRVFFLFEQEEIPLYQIDLLIAGCDDEGGILICISTENRESVYRLIIHETTPNFKYELISGPSIQVKRGNSEYIEFPEYMTYDPVIIHYIDGAFSYNCFLVKIHDRINGYNKNEIHTWDWGNVDIRKESMGYEREQNTIQYRSFELIKDDFDLIVNDDNSGEAADLIALKYIDNSIILRLVHCKYSSKNQSGSRVEDLYEVCGQAQRSVRWKHLGISFLFKHIQHRENLWRKKGYTRFLKGTMRDLTRFKNCARTSKLLLEVFIVQPGVCKSLISADMLKLLGSTELYIKKTTQADLTVIVSD